MSLEQSILKGTKKILGYEIDNHFDFDIITQINTSFVRLKQLGIGPAQGFMIEGDEETWGDYFQGADLDLNALKSYVYLKVRLFFDPPGTPHHLQAVKEQITELEHTLLTERELTKWQAPSSSLSLP